MEEIRIEVIFENYRKAEIINELFKSHPYEEVAYDIYPLTNNYQLIGSGMIGELPENQLELDFLKGVKEKMKAGVIRHTSLLGQPVRKVAICGGSGSFLLNEAISAGAGVFITADYKYHQFFNAENKIVIADIGHYESEQFTKDLLKTLILEKFSTFAVRLSEVNTNPVNYL
jgi:putative NIF3 family GTP cyclohydrolase 1 type 2